MSFKFKIIKCEYSYYLNLYGLARYITLLCSTWRENVYQRTKYVKTGINQINFTSITVQYNVIFHEYRTVHFYKYTKHAYSGCWYIWTLQTSFSNMLPLSDILECNKGRRKSWSTRYLKYNIIIFTNPSKYHQQTYVRQSLYSNQILFEIWSHL